MVLSVLTISIMLNDIDPLSWCYCQSNIIDDIDIIVIIDSIDIYWCYCGRQSVLILTIGIDDDDRLTKRPEKRNRKVKSVLTGIDQYQSVIVMLTSVARCWLMTDVLILMTKRNLMTIESHYLFNDIQSIVTIDIVIDIYLFIVNHYWYLINVEMWWLFIIVVLIR